MTEDWTKAFNGQPDDGPRDTTHGAIQRGNVGDAGSLNRKMSMVKNAS